MLSAPTSAFGVFVDPLFDDDMRDAGTPQTARIADRMLQLPMDVSIHQLPSPRDLSLPYTPEVIIDQPMHTKAMKVNPYMAFDPLPAEVTLTPAVDRWTDHFARSFASWRNETLDWSTQAEGSLRQIDVAIEATGFGYGEPVKVIFDGIEVPCTTTHADAEGRFQGTIRIPAGIPTGTKLVRLQGTHTRGDATFVGIRSVRTTINYYVPLPPRVDPLAQTFALQENRHVVGAEFWLAMKGVSPIRVEIREVELGLPMRTTVAMCLVRPEDLKAGEFNRVIFDRPVYLSAGVEYALVILTDTADHEVGIVELGDWDPTTGWVRSQQYQTGVLLSSANASTWTPHQATDLAFRLLGAVFHAASPASVELATIDLTGVTDVIPLAEVQRTSPTTDVTFVLSKDGMEIARMQTGQPLSFAAPLEGTYVVQARLFGESRFSPILGRDPQIVTGKLQSTGDYVSRAFRCGTGKKVMVTTEEYVPTGATVSVAVQTAPDTWTSAVVSEEEQIGSGWVRRQRFVPCGAATTKIKIDLSGTPAARPLVRNISGVILNA
jgi:hypothetical protein